MITTFFFDILPIWLEKSALCARESAIYGLLARLWRWVLGLWEESLSHRLLRKLDALGERAVRSRTAVLLDHCIDAVAWVFGKSLGWLMPPVQNSFLANALGRISGFRLSWMYGLVFAMCFCCPGPLWRNPYGLLLSGGLFAAGMVLSWHRGQPALRVREVGLWTLCFALAAVLAVVQAADRMEAIRVLTFYAAAFLLCFSAVILVTDRESLQSILGFVYGTLLLTSLYAIFQRFQGVEVNASLTDLAVNSGMPGRVYSTLENPNNYAEFIVLTFPVSLVFCANLRDRRWKTLALASLVVPVGALLMTYSRSGWVSFALAAVVFLGLYDKRLLPLVVIAGVLALPVLPDSIFNRILTIGSTADSSNAYRLYIWDSALQMLGDHGLTGIGLGPGNFWPLYATYAHPRAMAAQHSHMLYLEVWLEMGILGIVSFLGMYLGILRRGIRVRRQADPLVRNVLIGCVSALAGVSFVGAAEYIWFYPRVLFAFFVLVGLTLAALKLAEEPHPLKNP